MNCKCTDLPTGNEAILKTN